MKKFLALVLIPLTAACATYCNKPKCQKQPEPAPLPVVYEEPAREINPCACIDEVQPLREVLRPRITEEMPVEEKKSCCDHHQFLNCGCGMCDTFHPVLPQEEEVNEVYRTTMPVTTYIPAQPEAYMLAANRAFNRFIKDTYDIYSKKPNVKIYVRDPISKEKDLPAGLNKGVEVFKTQILNSHTFALTDNLNEADYTLATSAEWFDTPSKEVPAIRFVTKLIDKEGNDVNSWSQIVKRADNKSWL